MVLSTFMMASTMVCTLNCPGGCPGPAARGLGTRMVCTEPTALIGNRKMTWPDFPVNWVERNWCLRSGMSELDIEGAAGMMTGVGGGGG